MVSWAPAPWPPEPTSPTNTITKKLQTTRGNMEAAAGGSSNHQQLPGKTTLESSTSSSNPQTHKTKSKRLWLDLARS
jgi:hypothetical protein